MKKKHIKNAYPLWTENQAYKAGAIIYEHLRNEHRPLWAAEVLELCLSLIEKRSELVEVCKIARDPKRWLNAHDMFSKIRSLWPDDEEEPENSLYLAVLNLAENVCKVTYNASGEPAPFDQNSGHKLVVGLRKIVNLVGVSEFEKRAWYVVSSEEYSE